MASAYRDKKGGSGWIADFRPLNGKGARRRRVRIPLARIATAPDPAIAAQNFADECEGLCRLLERSAAAPLIEHATDIGAITPDQATALRNGGPIPPPTATPSAPHNVTIEQAFEQHPSVRRLYQQDPHNLYNHLRGLTLFLEHSGLQVLAHVRLCHVQAFIEHMRRQGYKYCTRSAYLKPIRQATRIGAAVYGLPDPISGFVLDRDSESPQVPDMPIAPIFRAIQNTFESANAPSNAATAWTLAAGAGLRPTEIIRAQVGDLQNGILSVGLRRRKNAQSRRDLPLAPTVLLWLTPAIANKQPDDPICPTCHNSHYAKASDIRGLTNISTEPVKTGRKIFATSMIRAGVQPHLVERYLGHTVSLATAITTRHYLARDNARRLQPVSDHMERLISEALSTPLSTHQHITQ